MKQYVKGLTIITTICILPPFTEVSLLESQRKTLSQGYLKTPQVQRDATTCPWKHQGSENSLQLRNAN